MPQRRFRGPARKPVELHGESNRGSNEPEYGVWTRMIRRCENPRDSGFASYGGRGVRVCSRWRNSYRAFVADMGRRPSPEHSIDRVDVDGNYAPENCRWVTRTDQARNTRASRRVTIRGEEMSVAEAIERFATVSKSAVFYRLNRGWPSEEAVMAARSDCPVVPVERRRAAT